VAGGAIVGKKTAYGGASAAMIDGTGPMTHGTRGGGGVRAAGGPCASSRRAASLRAVLSGKTIVCSCTIDRSGDCSDAMMCDCAWSATPGGACRCGAPSHVGPGAEPCAAGACTQEGDCSGGGAYGAGCVDGGAGMRVCAASATPGGACAYVPCVPSSHGREAARGSCAAGVCPTKAAHCGGGAYVAGSMRGVVATMPGGRPGGGAAGPGAGGARVADGAEVDGCWIRGTGT